MLQKAGIEEAVQNPDRIRSATVKESRLRDKTETFSIPLILIENPEFPFTTGGEKKRTLEKVPDMS